MPPYFSVITPTLDRPSLQVLMRSLERQSFGNWEQVIVHDREFPECTRRGPIHEQNWPRVHIECGVRHKDYGNTCRHHGWEYAAAGYLIYGDDDNRFADKDALQRIHDCLVDVGEPNVGIFPIMRHGVRFFHDPPRLCFFDTANMVVKREIGRWPEGPEYTMDGIFIERLVAEHGYVAFPDCDPIINVPVSSEGK